MKLPDGLNNLINRVGKNNLIVIASIVVLLILGFLLLRGNIGNPFQQNKPTIAVPTPRPTTVPGDTIMITFRALPQTLTIKKGRVVNFINFSGARVDIEGADAASKDLNVGILEDGGVSSTILLKTPGTYKYIDKLNPKITGEIVVTP